MRILVVDDDRAVRESLRRSLEFNGYTVQLAEDGEQAMDAVTRQRPDAMVLDMTMPRVGGLEVCRWLRCAGDDLPVLVLTARDEVSDRVMGLDAGADDYLPKPFLLEELLARLRALLRRSTFDRSGDLGVVLTFADHDPPVHVADSGGSSIEAPARGAKRATSRTTKIIAIVSVVIAAVGLIPPFVGTFQMLDVSDPKAGYSNVSSRIKIRSISFVNGVPEAVTNFRIGVEMRTAGPRCTCWIVLILILADGSVRAERRQIEEIPGVVIFPLDSLAVEMKRHLMVDVDVADVAVGACS